MVGYKSIVSLILCICGVTCTLYSIQLGYMGWFAVIAFLIGSVLCFASYYIIGLIYDRRVIILFIFIWLLLLVFAWYNWYADLGIVDVKYSKNYVVGNRTIYVFDLVGQRTGKLIMENYSVYVGD